MVEKYPLVSQPAIEAAPQTVYLLKLVELGQRIIRHKILRIFDHVHLNQSPGAS